MNLWSILLPTHRRLRSARVAAPDNGQARTTLAAALGEALDADAICQFIGRVDEPVPAVIELLQRGAPT